MWSYIARRLLYNIPVYLGIILLVMLALRVQDPVYAYLGKNASQEQYEQFEQSFGLDKPFLQQYVLFLGRIVTLDFSERSWEQQRPVGEIIADSVPATLMITAPSLVLTAAISIVIGLICAFWRGRPLDRGLMVLAVLGMSVSYLVYIIIGQYFGAFWLAQEAGIRIFAIEGYDQNLSNPGFWLKNPAAAVDSWIYFCALPVLIGVVVAMGYDTRFYRAVMVEETSRDYIITARAKGAPNRKIMFVHMLKNAMIPIITRIMITLPFLIEGSILVEMYFGIPGMGRTLITAINAKDFPIVQSVTAVFAGVVIITVILTDVLYALVDPRVRLR
jgi:peptide/nickel transport system permease protein